MGMMVPMTQLTQFQIKFHLRYGFDFEKKRYEKIATITIKAASVLSFPKKKKAKSPTAAVKRSHPQTLPVDGAPLPPGKVHPKKMIPENSSLQKPPIW